MNTTEINELIAQPGKVRGEHTEPMRHLMETYPWCQSFQLLYAKALKTADDPAFSQQLKRTAVYASDRKVLYRLIMQTALRETIAHIEQATLETPTISEEINITEAEPLTPQVSEELQGETLAATPEKPEVAQSAPEQIEDPQPEETLDATNLEKEVLKEVAALAYQRELESAIQVEPEPPAVVAPPASKKPTSFLDFISGGGASTSTTPPESEADTSSLIDRFIQNEPRIERKQASFFSPVNMGKMSLADDSDIVSETLANIYAKQGDLARAKKAYEQLALKFPEKSVYFAGLIAKLDESKPKK
ncbi:MAG: hypothetical protein EA392_05700 [Cryomorphaceae bacterium]|nr:MAG: hypothetical protein EA392_05700 [Cryomorphaceae bacterium]